MLKPHPLDSDQNGHEPTGYLSAAAKVAAVTCLVAGIVVGIGLAIIDMQRKATQSEQLFAATAVANREGEYIAGNLSTALTALSAFYGFAAPMVRKEVMSLAPLNASAANRSVSVIDPADFRALGEEVLARFPVVHFVSCIVGGVLAHAWPPAPVGPDLGLDLFPTSQIVDLLVQAMRGNWLVAGPMALVQQGGVAYVARIPLYARGGVARSLADPVAQRILNLSVAASLVSFNPIIINGSGNLTEAGTPAAVGLASWWGTLNAVVRVERLVAVMGIANRLRAEGYSWCLVRTQGNSSTLAAGSAVEECQDLAACTASQTVKFALLDSDARMTLCLTAYGGTATSWNQSQFSLVIIVGVFGGIVAGVSLLTALIYRRRMTNGIQYAPKLLPVALVVVGVARSFELWSIVPQQMVVTMPKFFKIVRSVIASHEGYEASHLGDELTVAFRSADDAARFAKDLHKRLEKSSSWCGGLTGRIFCKTTLHLCGHPGSLDICFDAARQRYSYAGEDAVIVARLHRLQTSRRVRVVATQELVQGLDEVQLPLQLVHWRLAFGSAQRSLDCYVNERLPDEMHYSDAAPSSPPQPPAAGAAALVPQQQLGPQLQAGDASVESVPSFVPGCNPFERRPAFASLGGGVVEASRRSRGAAAAPAAATATSTPLVDGMPFLPPLPPVEREERVGDAAGGCLAPTARSFNGAEPGAMTPTTALWAAALRGTASVGGSSSTREALGASGHLSNGGGGPAASAAAFGSAPQELVEVYNQEQPYAGTPPFSQVGIIVLAFYRSYAILLSHLAEAEQRNLFKRFSQAFGLPPNSTAVHLAVSCAIEHVRRQSPPTATSNSSLEFSLIPPV